MTDAAVRQCGNHACRGPVAECMGFVRAGDILEVAVETRDKRDVRELCSRCGMLAVAADMRGEPLERVVSSLYGELTFTPPE